MKINYKKLSIALGITLLIVVGFLVYEKNNKIVIKSVTSKTTTEDSRCKGGVIYINDDWSNSYTFKKGIKGEEMILFDVEYEIQTVDNVCYHHRIVSPMTLGAYQLSMDNIVPLESIRELEYNGEKYIITGYINPGTITGTSPFIKGDIAVFSITKYGKTSGIDKKIAYKVSYITEDRSLLSLTPQDIKKIITDKLLDNFEKLE